MSQLAAVTGANRGIGLEVARQLARLGFRVVLACRDPVKAESAAAGLREEGRDAVARALDVANEESRVGFVAATEKDLGPVDVLVNNAGLYPDNGRRADVVAPATLREALETNAIGPYRLTQLLLPGMRFRGFGRIVNVSSGMGEFGSLSADSPAYRLSKTALNAITVMQADLVRGTGVLVNAVCPGWVKTDMGGKGATRTVARGAETIVWLATLPAGGPTGGFFRDRKPIDW